MSDHLHHPVRQAVRRLQSSRPRGPVLPRIDASRVTPHLPALKPIRIEVNGIFAGSPTALGDATSEFAVGWAFMHHFFERPDQFGSVRVSPSHVALMLESGANLDRCAYAAIGWVDPDDDSDDPMDTARHPRAVAVMDGMDAIATYQAALTRFDEDGAGVGYTHAGLASVDDVHCIARDRDCCNAVAKVLGWAISTGAGLEATMLVVRGMVDATIVTAAHRAGIAIVATDSVPTACAMSMAERSCVSILGLMRSHRRAVFVDAGHVDDEVGDLADDQGTYPAD